MSYDEEINAIGVCSSNDCCVKNCEFNCKCLIGIVQRFRVEEAQCLSLHSVNLDVIDIL